MTRAILPSGSKMFTTPLLMFLFFYPFLLGGHFITGSLVYFHLKYDEHKANYCCAECSTIWCLSFSINSFPFKIMYPEKYCRILKVIHRLYNQISNCHSQRIYYCLSGPRKLCISHTTQKVLYLCLILLFDLTGRFSPVDGVLMEVYVTVCLCVCVFNEDFN